MKIPMLLVFGLAMLVFLGAIVVAEGSLKDPAQIPDAVFFGIPFAGLGMTLLSAYRGFTLSKARGEDYRRMRPYVRRNVGPRAPRAAEWRLTLVAVMCEDQVHNAVHIRDYVV